MNILRASLICRGHLCKLLARGQYTRLLKNAPDLISSIHTSKMLTAKKEDGGQSVGGKKPKTDIDVNSSAISYIEDVYNAWLRDPKSVDESWAAYFKSQSTTMNGGGALNPVPIANMANVQPQAPAGPSVDSKVIDDHLAVQAIIRSYQMRGHYAADLDPLQLIKREQTVTKDGFQRWANENVLRQHTTYTFGKADLDRQFKLPMTTFIGGEEKSLPLREILLRLENVYCNRIGLEYMHIVSLDLCNWIRKQFEVPNVIQFTKEEKLRMLKRLAKGVGFEMFLQKKFSSEKRFGLEGCEVLIPALQEIIDRSTLWGVKSIILGMAHRGRLNCLANVARKQLEDIFTQFAGLKATDSGSGDVKYHLGTYTNRLNRATDKHIRLALIANPSHLEWVNPVVLGRAKAEQFYRGDVEGKQVLPIIIHGDASFCGQGIVYECMHLSHLPNYSTHGTINVVVNNQIGFTTDPRFSRSSPYCTDVGRVVDAPIFHVNADDVESVIHVCRVAAEWRARYHKDVVIDLVCYRRNGHNEIDEPMFTQPFMYKKIRQHKNVLDIFSEKMVKEGVATANDVKTIIAEYDKVCETAFAKSKEVKSIKYSKWIDSPWDGFFEGKDPMKVCPTAVSMDTLMHIGEKFSSLPPLDEFDVHSGLKRVMAQRKELVKKQVADWALAEAFAIGSLLKDGVHVRLSGEDVERGTFSHRHHVLHHQTRDKATYYPLHHLYPDQAVYTVSNSSLSEAGVLGFEHGYSMANPNALIIWEAQFGDFVNTAQCILDQFIASGETKWVRQSGIVLLLPHAMEGNGPEHSSGRIERFLENCCDDPDVYPQECDDPQKFAIKQICQINWIVANCSTPATFFHILRRQIALQFRKPLIVFTPKGLLRHPDARSPFCDMAEGSIFMRIIPDEGPACECPDHVQRVIFTSGPLYYELRKAREDRQMERDIAIIRLEQFAPFPYDLISQQLKFYKDAELVWSQEEHKNQGAWNYVQQRFRTALRYCGDGRCVEYVGRPPSAAPATGNKAQHMKEHKDIITTLFGELTEEQQEMLEEKMKRLQAEAKAIQEAKKKVEAEEKKALAAKKNPPKPGDKKDDKAGAGKPAAKPEKPGAEADCLPETATKSDKPTNTNKPDKR